MQRSADSSLAGGSVGPQADIPFVASRFEEVHTLGIHRERGGLPFFHRRPGADAPKRYQGDPIALQLRGMNMLFEGFKEKGSMAIVPAGALETMNLDAQLGTVALAKAEAE